MIKLEKLQELVMLVIPKIALAIVVLLVGLFIINQLVKLMGVTMQRARVGEDVRPFLQSITGALLKVLLLFSVAGILGIETTSFVAVIAAAGFAVGLALQGSLSNFAAGVMILIFKPFRVSDVVSIQGKMGTVKQIEIFNTIIVTFDNKTVIVPSSMAVSDLITNLSKEGYLRVDMSVAMPYEEDFQTVKNIILEALINTPHVLKDPMPMVGIDEFDSHNIRLAIWPYCETEHYWEVYFSAKQSVFEAFAANGIKMAYSEGVELGNIGKGGKKIGY